MENEVRYDTIRYDTIRYEESGDRRLLDLHSFDGTYRSVSFRTDMDAALAMSDGRAEADCTAIEYGMLPRGATLVSRKGALRPDHVLADMNGGSARDVNPLESVRLGFSQKLLVDRSMPMTRRKTPRCALITPTMRGAMKPLSTPSSAQTRPATFSDRAKA